MTAGEGSIYVSSQKDTLGNILTKSITLGLEPSSDTKESPTTGFLRGTWTLNGVQIATSANGASIATTSDINKKHSINSLTNQYSMLFDNLHPVTYKYNDGTSNRLHTGFIEVKEGVGYSEYRYSKFRWISCLGTWNGRRIMDSSL